jgi:uncharacterized membrane protein
MANYILGGILVGVVIIMFAAIYWYCTRDNIIKDVAECDNKYLG